MSDLAKELFIIRPELVVGIGAILLLLIGVTGSQKGMRLVSWLGVAILIVATITLYYTVGAMSVFNGAFVTDNFARFAKALVLLGSSLAIILAQDYFEEAKIARF